MRFSFQLNSDDKRRALPHRLTIGLRTAETETHALLKLLGYVLFFRDRLQLGINLHNDSIPYVPGLVQLDYELRPVLWVECGECSIKKLDKLAVKAPEAEIRVLLPSRDEADALLNGMARNDLRRNRYQLIAFDGEMFAEMKDLLESRNQLLWVAGGFEPPNLQFDFNGLWFDAPFELIDF